jgi:PKD repeat protein
MVIWQAPAQTADAVGNNLSCDAAFSSSPDPLNPMVIRFQDNSSGQITLWQWNFGDGTTSTAQNPVHTYNSGGNYFVCLTVSDSDPGFLCHDVLCVVVTVHEPGACVADYRYSIDPMDQYKVKFTDQSSGNINSWHWDFGDGTFSYDRNPTHGYASYGKYFVCLTAYNSDSVATCNDVKCDSVAVNGPAFCHADFTSELDTLNPVPNTFKFNSISTGGPNKFRWKFDDGFISDDPFVVHHFQSPGQHEVCLVVKKEIHGEIICTDSTCKTIFPAKYFDLGGHLFIGSFPINNPVAAGDTGIAYLYRADGPKLIPFDTCQFTSMGYYTFPRVLNGSYVVRAALTSGSTHYSKYFPAYYRQAIAWKDAQTVNLSDTNSYLSDINLVPAPDSLTGQCVLRGSVQRAYSKANEVELPFAEVLLLDSQLKPVTFTFSGKSGDFEMKNIPYGAYNLYVEYPGKYSRLTAVWLDAATQMIDSILLEVFNHDVTGIQANHQTGIFAGNLFPNPATNSVSLNLELEKAAMLKFEIRTLTGIIVWSGTNSFNAGSGVVTVPLRSVGTGMYLFTISNIDGTPVAVKKLLRY